MIKPIVFSILCVGLLGSFNFAEKSDVSWSIGPVKKISLETSGECKALILKKDPSFFPRQKCRLG